MLLLTRTAPLNSHVEQFCGRIRQGPRPQLMVIRPSPGWEPNDCFSCVRERVRRDAGRIQLGWSIWEWPGVYIEDERHAVYAPAGGSAREDISPSAVAEITNRLFLPDDTAVEYDFNNVGVREENIREAPVDDERIRRFFQVAEQQNAIWNSVPVFGEITLDRATASRLEGLEQEKNLANCGIGDAVHATERAMLLREWEEIQDAIARNCICAGARGRFFTTVDLVNRLKAEARAGRQGRIADYLTRMDFIILGELGYLPFAQSVGQLLFHLVSRLYRP